MTRKDWMNNRDEDMTYTDDGYPALLQFDIATWSYIAVEIEAGEGV